MVNPLLVRAGLKVAKKVGKKAIKKIKQRRNSTDNLTQGPLDKAIKKQRPRGSGPSIYNPNRVSGGDRIPNNLTTRPEAGTRGTLGPKPKPDQTMLEKGQLKKIKRNGRTIIVDA